MVRKCCSAFFGTPLEGSNMIRQKDQLHQHHKQHSAFCVFSVALCVAPRWRRRLAKAARIKSLSFNNWWWLVVCLRLITF